MAKKKPTTPRRTPTELRQPSPHEMLKYSVEDLARQATMADPRVQRIKERHAARIAKAVKLEAPAKEAKRGKG